MNRTRLALVVILALMIASTVSFFFWDFVRDTLVVPIYFLLWVSDLIIKSVPQQAYLAVLVLLCATIALNTMLRGNANAPVQRRSRGQYTESTRYVYWRRLYRNLYGSPLFRNKLAAEIREFLLTMLAHQEGLDSTRVEAMILDGSLAVPPAVRQFVQERAFDVPQRELTFLETLGQRLRGLLIDSRTEAPLPLNAHVAEVITFIEDRLEIDHAGN